MKVTRPGSPQGGASEPLEPLDPRDARGILKGDRFADVLSGIEAGAAAGQSETGAVGGAAGSGGASGAHSPTRSALAEIAKTADLVDPAAAQAAVRRSAEVVGYKLLKPEFRDTESGRNFIAQLSTFVSDDPLLKSKFMAILTKLKAGAGVTE